MLVIAVTGLMLVFFLLPVLIDRNSWLRSWLWCTKHGLRLKEYTFSQGGGAVFWSGVDSYGNEYVPDEEGNPRPLR